MVVLMKRAVLGIWLAAVAFAQQQPQQQRKPDRVVSIVAERFTFNPSKITVKEGQLIEFVLTSDDTDHGFRIPEAGIDVAIPPSGRGEVKVRFLVNRKGEFVFECSRPCGAGHNLMRGTIQVK